MKSVLCFGEALVDIFTTDEYLEDRLSLPNYRQYPGGAPANAAVAVAKLGGQAKFIGQVGADPFGHFLINALNTYGVDTRLLRIAEHAQTALAFVFLDEAGERSFNFYRNQTADLLLKPEHIDSNCLDKNSILHFCSNTLTHSSIAQTTEHVVQSAQEASALISFDVNLRHNLWEGGKAGAAVVNRVSECAHILKFTREELAYLAGDKEAGYIDARLAIQAQLIVVTDADRDFYYYTRTHRGKLPPPQTTAVDSTGAGDAFIGALLYGVSQQQTLASLTEQPESLEVLLMFSAHCGAHAVGGRGVFPALPEMRDVAQYWRAS